MRAFIGVEVSDPAVREAIATFQGEFPPQARRVAPDSLHFTLAFLGEITEEQCRQTKAALGAIPFEPFRVRLEGAGAFPRARRPRVVWVGADGESGRRLSALAETVRGVLPPGVSPLGRPFAPHVTILRVRGSPPDLSGILGGRGGFLFGSFEASAVRLKRSVLTPRGPVYSDMLVVGG